MSNDKKKRQKSNPTPKIKINEGFGENLSAQEQIKKGFTVRSKPIIKPNTDGK